MSLDTRKIIFFIAGTVPTAGELALIARIRGIVVVRSVLRDVTYAGGLEAADGLAGAIPDSYKTGEGTTIDTAVYTLGDVTPALVDKPEASVVVGQSALAVAATTQLRMVAAEYNDATGEIALTDVTETATFESANVAKATVTTGGIVTGVEAGAVSIIGSYEYDTGVSVTAAFIMAIS